MSNEIENIKKQLVIHAVKLHMLSHNISDSNNTIVIESEIEIDWEGGFVSFDVNHSGTFVKKQYSFYQLGIEDLHV